MSLLDITIKEIFGAKYSKYALLLVAGIAIAVATPKYLVTVPVFAEAIQKVQQQIMNGDLIQERQWLTSQNAQLKREKMEIYRKNDDPSEVERQMIKDLDCEINDNTKRIHQIDGELKEQWKE